MEKCVRLYGPEFKRELLASLEESYQEHLRGRWKRRWRRVTWFFFLVRWKPVWWKNALRRRFCLWYRRGKPREVIILRMPRRKK